MKSHRSGIGSWVRIVPLLVIGLAVAAAVVFFALASPGTGTVSANPVTDCDTTLAAPAGAASSSITVTDPTGCDQDDSIVINGGGATEECQQILDPAGAVLYLHGSLSNNHSAGETVVEVAECPTPTPTPTATPEATETPEPTATPTATPEATATATPTATPPPATATPPPATATPPPATATPPPATATPPPATATPPPATATPPPPTATPTATATIAPTALPPTGMGQSGDGGSMGTAALLALGGLAALAGAAGLTWRLRRRKA